MAAKKKLSRDQKRALKKAKRTPPPRGARTLLPSPSLLQPLHNAGWDNYTVLHNLVVSLNTRDGLTHTRIRFAAQVATCNPGDGGRHDRSCLDHRRIVVLSRLGSIPGSTAGKRAPVPELG